MTELTQSVPVPGFTLPATTWPAAYATALALFVPTSLQAQYPINLGTNPIIAGISVECFNATTVLDSVSDIAIARPGFIILNPAFFQLPDRLQLFIYAHECGHHVPNIGSNEGAADCWAIRAGRDQGWFSRDDIGFLILMFGNSPGDWTHAPGPVRIGRLIACFDSP